MVVADIKANLGLSGVVILYLVNDGHGLFVAAAACK